MNSVPRKILITAVSWEERFVRGLERLLANEVPEAVVLLCYRRVPHEAASDRERAERMCERVECDVTPVTLRYQRPVDSWKAIRDALRRIVRTTDEAVLDITTMPREAIWATLLLLAEEGVSVRYAYHLPKHYGEWLSRDPGTPRLALKLAGEMRFGMDTVLCVLTGFDRERTLQLVRTFDPKTVLLGVQSGAQFANQTRNAGEHGAMQFGRDGRSVEVFDVNAYAADHGFSEIVSRVTEHVESKNVLMASLGPKLSSLALYRVQRQHPTSGLVYTPSGEYNREYSTGIGETITGVVDPGLGFSRAPK